MLNNFNFIKSCFGSDDEEEEKFEIKHKKERKVAYRQGDQNKKTNKKKNKKSRKNFLKKKMMLNISIVIVIS